MAFEALAVAAHAMGRTLVLPPRTTDTWSARHTTSGFTIEDFHDLKPLEQYQV
jgi:hypothetical protein